MAWRVPKVELGSYTERVIRSPGSDAWQGIKYPHWHLRDTLARWNRHMIKCFPGLYQEFQDCFTWHCWQSLSFEVSTEIGFTLQCTRWMQCSMISMPLDWLPCQIWPCFSISSFNMDLVACHSGYLIWHILIGSTEGSSLGPRQDESRTVGQFLWRNHGTASISLALWKTCKTKTAKAADPYVNYL